MLSKEMLNKIKHIEIRSNRLVDEVFAGEYRSSFKGKGMAFEDIREYYHGDDVRNIDWNVTARYNKAFIKQFNEERELNIFMLVDMSFSNNFGKKKELIAELSATIAFSAIRNNDRVGAVLFTDHVEKFIPSQKGRKHVLSIIDTVLSYQPKAKGTNLKSVIDYYSRVVKRKSVLFIISDFMDEGYEKSLTSLSNKHDVILVQVTDPVEKEIPKGAIFTFQDLETGEIVTIDNRKGTVKLHQLEGVSKKNLISISTDEDYVKKLKAFFMRRMLK